MTPERLNQCMRIIRWHPDVLAKAVDVPSETVRAWITGATEVPQRVSGWIEALSFVHEAAEKSIPFTTGEGFDGARSAEHVPVYAYNLLRSLEVKPVAINTLFGTEDEAAVYFLVSRGLARRVEDQLLSTDLGQGVGAVLYE